MRVKIGTPVIPAAILLASALSGCDDHVIGQSAPFVVTCLRDPPLTYENFGKGMLDRHCNSCHTEAAREGQRGGAPLGVDFDDWDMVLQWAERIEVRTVEESTMPPSGGTLLAYEREQFAEWMRCEVLPSLGQNNEAPSEEEAP